MRATRGMAGGSRRSADADALANRLGTRRRGAAARRAAASVVARTAGVVANPNAFAFGMALTVAIWLAAIALAGSYGVRPFAPDQDARAYWLAGWADPYQLATVGVPGAYLYSPAFLEVMAPLRALPWPGFVIGWTLVLLVATAYLAGPSLLAPVMALAFIEIWGGNISLLLGAAIVLGFRWPATWAFVLLTKVTPGLGLLWFAVRREWGRLLAALLATAAVVAVSALTGLGQWAEWLRVLAGNVGSDGTWAAIHVPLLPRLPIAAAVIIWAARGDRRWALPIGCLLALPVIWYGSLTLLLAVPALLRPDRGDWSSALAGLGAWLAGSGRVAATALDGLARAQRSRAGERAERSNGPVEADAG